MGRAAWPRAWACAWPKVRNAVEQIVTAAVPRLAISTLSWILHDVHEPQSPEPVITKSQVWANASITSEVAGTEAEGLRRVMTWRTP